MDPITTLLVSIVAGLVSGGVGGAVAAYILRRLGDVDCEITGWHKNMTSSIMESYRFTVKFFNHKEVATALWNIRVAAYAQDGQEIDSIVPESWPDKLPELDLPPGVTVTRQLDVKGDAVRLSKMAEDETVTVKLEGTFTGGDSFERTIEKTPAPIAKPT